VDPFTLFALANGAVSAIKKGCQLYKDIKGAAGDVKAVLKDLDDQFHKSHPPENPPTTAQRNQFIEEKNRVIELNKKAGETDDIYTEIGNQLGDYLDNMNKCLAVLEEEERVSRTQVYSGDASLAKRALQRVLMKKKLEAMTKEIREMMIYNAPAELGALFTDVSEMMESMGKEQKILIARKMQQEERAARRRRERLKTYVTELSYAGFMIIVAVTFVLLMSYVTYDRKTRWPELEPEAKAQRHREKLEWWRAQQERQEREMASD
jgi:hypothetical protein